MSLLEKMNANQRDYISELLAEIEKLNENYDNKLTTLAKKEMEITCCHNQYNVAVQRANATILTKDAEIEKLKARVVELEGN